jgi:hypothetical protein
MSRLDLVDIAAGLPLGTVRTRRATDGVHHAPVHPWQALEEALLPALAAPPLAVSFSGGRDSSLILAAAVSAARRQGLAPPIAITTRFANAPGSVESDWQEKVIRALGVSDWEVLHLHDELDYLGSIATDGLRQFGLQFPPNAHSVIPVARTLGRGTILVGNGGDELLGSWRWAPRLAALRRPLADGLARGPRAVGGVLFGAAPQTVRSRIFRRRVEKELRDGAAGYRWLTPAGRDAVLPGLVDANDAPVTWTEFIPWAARRRNLMDGDATIHRLGQAEGVDFLAPLLEPNVLAALAGARRGRGWSDREEAMRDIAGDRLPLEVINRRDKADFVDVFWGPSTRRFAQTWDGSGVSPDYIDREALRQEWCSKSPDFRSTLLLQSAWLHSQAG